MYLHCFTFLRGTVLLTSPELSTSNNLCHFQRCKMVLFNCLHPCHTQECLIIATLVSLFSPLQMAQ
uniref:Uncharacterized protein n=1 Tax=Pan troglodytes TaxID=9598 RepID=G2HDW7_PANTR|nr:hypothetical protein [Pan troglodytes]